MKKKESCTDVSKKKKNLFSKNNKLPFVVKLKMAATMKKCKQKTKK